MQFDGSGASRQPVSAIYSRLGAGEKLSTCLALARRVEATFSDSNSGNPTRSTVPLPSSTTAPPSGERPTYRAPLVELAAAALDSAISSGR